MASIAEVRLWGRRIAAVYRDDGSDVAAFEYDPAFVGSRIEVSNLIRSALWLESPPAEPTRRKARP
ncbi:MAG: hypothetical protein ACRETZ_01045 [Steroidobacteraceae bacterium]